MAYQKVHICLILAKRINYESPAKPEPSTIAIKQPIF